MPKIVDHDARRREITEAAADLIAEGGPAALTMRVLSARCGVANGALERYFPTKGDILAACYELAYERLRARTRAELAGAEPGLDALRVLVRSLLPLSTEGWHVARVMLAFWNELSAVPEVRERVFADAATMRSRFLEQLRLAEARGQGVRGGDHEAVAWTLYVFVIGAYHAAQGPDGAAAPEIQTAALDLILGGA